MRDVKDVAAELMHSLNGLTLPSNIAKIHEELCGMLANHVIEAPSVFDLPEPTFEAYERACIVRVLARARGNKHLAANMLKIGKSTLHRKITKHKIK